MFRTVFISNCFYFELYAVKVFYMQLISHGIVILNKSVLFSNKSNCSAGRGTDSLHELGDRYLSSQCLILARFYILLIVWNFIVVFISLRERMAFQHVSLHLKCLPNSLTLFDIDIISLAFHIREISVWGMACTFDQYVHLVIFHRKHLKFKILPEPRGI